MNPCLKRLGRWSAALTFATSSVAFVQTIDVPLRNWTVSPYPVGAIPAARPPESFSQAARRNLVTNGTYNDDGSLSLQTARRLDWLRIWNSLSIRVQE